MTYLKSLLKDYSMTLTFFVSAVLFTIIGYSYDWMLANFFSGFFTLGTFIMIEIDSTQKSKRVNKRRFENYLSDQKSTLEKTRNKQTDYGIIDDIVSKVIQNHNGLLICKKQKADLFVYIDGHAEVIHSVDTKGINFVNSKHDVTFYDTDIHHLVYLNNIL
jgi:hypothetical protein